MEDQKLKYPRNAKGICTGCGSPMGFHKKNCPADVGRQPNKEVKQEAMQSEARYSSQA